MRKVASADQPGVFVKRRALVPEVLWSIARIYFMLKTSPFPSRTGYVDPMREEQSLILTVLCGSNDTVFIQMIIVKDLAGITGDNRSIGQAHAGDFTGSIGCYNLADH